MKTFSKILTSFFLTVTVLSCGTNKEPTPVSEINVKPNEAYKLTRKAYSESLSKKAYLIFRKKLEAALKAKIPADKTILVNFYQGAPNCIAAGFNESSNEQSTQRIEKIAQQLALNNNTYHYFVYTSDSYNAAIYENNSDFQLDTGYFYNTVFTEHDNCAGFLILKPNGMYYNYYGEDYFSEVKKILEEK